MRKAKRTLIGALAAAALTLTTLGMSQAQATGGEKSREPLGASTTRSPGPAPDAAAPAALAAPGAAGALDMIQRRIAAYVEAHGTQYGFGSYVDGTSGQIVLQTDAPEHVVAELTALPGASAAESAAVEAIRLVGEAPSDNFGRRDDSPPFYGGGGLAAAGFLCSSGYAVTNAAGTSFMSTAGHCWANGTTVTTESGRYTYGTVSNRHLPPVTGDAIDVELIGGQSYAGRTFTGGVDSSTSIPVVSAGSASVGYNDYCHSGRTTGENCGHTATSITGQVCTQTGCKSPVIVYTGGTISQPGDSGGTFYAKNSSGSYIRGHVIAGSSTTGYAEPWTEVARVLGVSIVTG
ncbi:hypothetical protein [Streptomyces clavuligerus]|uniref:Serine protease n=1 Tax=Streptomyces clavuligerus TaxID=1901 RepID=E2Q5Y3_STRCL|nr:hypothetical protein [Streptomyces clavuligerus]ANW21673.1 hypothetical protein BB341_27400 [Streptomyces clavuligerus]AXU16302.1 hypothetical protein D1794_28475 [Streptomyces clavuligerus]EFG05143.1 Hypothetical protein SCLAV_0067 [Streptomyces clavuligerus]MBY6306462.1 hypothetical protein [Streptomyces clavuligerus]QCS09081.1 hypothetical protein CRV15_27830 [Streptomyces clavuligerus]